jgi:hypothetical protein
MRLEFILLFATVLIMPIFYFIFGTKLFFIYFLIWVDKLIIGLLKPLRYAGIQLTVLASVFAAIYYGPVTSFIFVLVLFTFLQSLRYLIIPIASPNYIYFIPNTDSIIAALGGLIAGLLSSYSFGIILIITIMFHHLSYVTLGFIEHKPYHVIGLVGGLIFHVIVLIPFGLSIMPILG